MERDEFIKSLGLGLALVCTGTCFQACSKGGNDENNPTPNPPGGGGNTASVDLSQKLQNIGDYAAANGVLFIRTAAGNQASSFVATEAICPHQGGNLIWKAADNRIQCQTHFSEYSSAGAVLAQPQGGGTTRTLKVYAVAVSGTTLTATVA
jgi:Rieske Fe-S protein